MYRLALVAGGLMKEKESRSPNVQWPKTSLVGVECYSEQNLILCIDDDERHLELQKRLLEEAGYEVMSCTDYREALAWFCLSIVRLVVIDYSMPRLNGVEVARIIRQAKPGVPIVMLSGHQDPPQGLGDAIDTYIGKGEGPDVLLENIRELLARRPVAAGGSGSQPRLG